MTDLALRLLTRGYLAVGHPPAGATDPDDAVTTPVWTRLLGRRALVVSSESGARAFYDETLVARDGAVPPPLAHLLFGRGAVHLLDGSDHRRRKAWFLEQVSDPREEALVEEVRRRLAGAAGGWDGQELSVFNKLVRVYGSSVMHWAGCQPSVGDRWVPTELARIVDGFGGAGLAFPRGWIARLRTDRWLRDRVRATREGRRHPPEGSPLAAVAATDLPVDVAAVELGNLVRPTVAVAWLGTFAALQLVQHRSWAERLATPAVGPDHVAFAHEVRRTTPFAPALAGRVVRHGEVDRERVSPGDRLVLDVRGAHLDPRRWPDPLAFRPERFLDHRPGPFELVPQGGGAPEGHRCPGEPVTVRIVAETARALASAGICGAGSHHVRLTRIPTRPPHGLRARFVSPARSEP